MSLAKLAEVADKRASRVGLEAIVRSVERQSTVVISVTYALFDAVSGMSKAPDPKISMSLSHAWAFVRS
jgi:hypothetical protein